MKRRNTYDTQDKAAGFNNSVFFSADR